MNKHLEIFLIKAAELYTIDEEGSMSFSVKPPSRYFDCYRYAEGVPRTEDTEIGLSITVDKRNNVTLELYVDDLILDTTELSFVNANVASIAHWLKSANVNVQTALDKEPEHCGSYVRVLAGSMA